MRHCSFGIIMLLLAALMPGMAQAQDRSAANARQRREQIRAAEAKARANTPYKAEAIMTLAPAELIEILEDEEASMFAKAKACQQLAVVGDKTAVPALAALLTDPKLSHYARFGLEPIPDPSVDAALRDALGKVGGNLLVGIINSIGKRGDLKAIEPLAKLMHNDNTEVAQAATAALALIRSP